MVKQLSWSAKLKIITEQLNLTRMDLVMILHDYYSQWEAISLGKQNPSDDFLKVVCHRLDVNPDWLIKNQDEKVLLSHRWYRSDDETIRSRLQIIKGDLTVNEFAEKVEIPVTVAVGILSGTTGIHYKQIRQIAEEMNVSTEWILYGNEASKENPCDERMIDFLREDPEARKAVRVLMEKNCPVAKIEKEKKISDAEWLQSIRAREHLSQSKLAKRLGVSSGLISLIETQRRRIGEKMRTKILEEFGE